MLNRRPSRPTRVWVKNTGPGLSSRTASGDHREHRGQHEQRQRRAEAVEHLLRHPLRPGQGGLGHVQQRQARDVTHDRARTRDVGDGGRHQHGDVAPRQLADERGQLARPRLGGDRDGVGPAGGHGACDVVGCSDHRDRGRADAQVGSVGGHAHPDDQEPRPFGADEVLADLDHRSRGADQEQPVDVAAVTSLAVQPLPQHEPGEQREHEGHGDEHADVPACDHQAAEEVGDGDDREEVHPAVEHAPVLVGADAEDQPVVATGQGEHRQPHGHGEHGHQHVGDVGPGQQRGRPTEAQQVGDDEGDRDGGRVGHHVGGPGRDLAVAALRRAPRCRTRCGGDRRRTRRIERPPGLGYPHPRHAAESIDRPGCPGPGRAGRARHARPGTRFTWAACGRRRPRG